MKFLCLPKRVVTWLCVLVAPVTLHAQQTIPINDVLNHTGETVSVCGKVYSVSLLKNVRSKPTLINVGGASAAERLTVRIRFENRANFSYNPEELFLNKNICFQGIVTKAHGYAEIIIDSLNKDKLLSEVALAKTDPIATSDNNIQSTVSQKYKKVIHQLPVNAYVLCGPNLNEPIITYLKAGSKISISYTTGGWSYVKVEKDISNPFAIEGVYGFVRNLSVGMNNKGEILAKGGRFTLVGNLLRRKQKASSPENVAFTSFSKP